MGCPINGLVLSVAVLPTMKVTLPPSIPLSFRRQGPRVARSQAVPSPSSSGRTGEGVVMCGSHGDGCVL